MAMLRQPTATGIARRKSVRPLIAQRLKFCSLLDLTLKVCWRDEPGIDLRICGSTMDFTCSLGARSRCAASTPPSARNGRKYAPRSAWKFPAV